jgi:hypothetical protein
LIERVRFNDQLLLYDVGNDRSERRHEETFRSAVNGHEREDVPELDGVGEGQYPDEADSRAADEVRRDENPPSIESVGHDTAC